MILLAFPMTDPARRIFPVWDRLTTTIRIRFPRSTWFRSKISMFPRSTRCRSEILMNQVTLESVKRFETRTNVPERSSEVEISAEISVSEFGRRRSESNSGLSVMSRTSYSISESKSEFSKAVKVDRFEEKDLALRFLKVKSSTNWPIWRKMIELMYMLTDLKENDKIAINVENYKRFGSLKVWKPFEVGAI